MKSWAILTHPIPGNHWTSLICRPLTGCVFSRMLSYTLFKYCYPFWHFHLKETKKRQILVNIKPNCAGNNNNWRRLPQLSEHDRSTNFIPFPRSCPGKLWIWYHIFEISPVFDTLNAIRALRAWLAKKIPFLRVLIYADDVQAPMRHTPGHGVKASRVVKGGGGGCRSLVCDGRGNDSWCPPSPQARF